MHCPFCGPRALREFEFHKTLPDAGATDAYARTYERVASLSRSLEHWQHVQGCRAWLLVLRNPSTDEVIDVQLLGGRAP
jgi:sarcosine oxidase subunit delta